MPELHHERYFSDGRRVVVVSSHFDGNGGSHARYKRVALIEMAPGYSGVPYGLSARYASVNRILSISEPKCAGKSNAKYRRGCAFDGEVKRYCGLLAAMPDGEAR